MVDATIDALLAINSDDVNRTSIQAIQAIVAELAKQIRQEVGDVQIWAQDQYKQYKDLLDSLLKDPAQMLTPALHFIGGTSVNEAKRVTGNSDSRRGNSIPENFINRTASCRTDLRDTTFIDCDDVLD